MMLYRPFATVLIANRGEIACRVIRTARRLGFRTVAVYSEADAASPHVAQADAAICIGPPAPAASYLDIGALLAAARATGADAVHPGYGFLSERADFARACGAAGLVFIGPPPHCIEAMGNKAVAKRRMAEAGVPCVPGHLGAEQGEATLTAQALALGFPLLVKAVAGGGGRGIRRVQAAAALPEALAGARREAQAAFGDGTLMLERLIEHARHVEIQVFADAHGHVIHLGERDCSTQRRRQKLIEESPAPGVGAALRAAIGRDAVTAARAVGYVGAGTVEFIVDGQLRHHFLEMNTRLQVEHPVTEMVTGVDLVEWQLRAAAGEPLGMAQDQIRIDGHSIEARLVAEDPGQGFRPQTGRIAWWRPDAARRPGMRIDDGVAEGSAVGPMYDGLLAKLIVHGRDRADAIRRLGALLEDAPLLGLGTNGRFLRDLIRHPDFVESRIHTGLLDEWVEAGEPILQPPQPTLPDWLAAAGLLLLQEAAGAQGLRPDSVATAELRLRCGPAQWQLRARRRGRLVELQLGAGSQGGHADQVPVSPPADGATHRVELLGMLADGRFRLAIDGVQRPLAAVVEGGRQGQGARVLLASGAACLVFEEASAYPAAATAADARRLCSPVAGTVSQLRVAPGDAVASGQPLLCIEAMKMEMWLAAGAAGRVKAVHAAVGESVAAQALLVELELALPATAPDSERLATGTAAQGTKRVAT